MNVIKDKQIVVYRNIHAAQKQTPFVRFYPCLDTFYHV